MARSSHHLLPQVLAAPVVAASLFLLPASFAEAGRVNQISNSLPWWQQLLQPNGTLPALGVGGPIAWAIMKKRDDLLKKMDNKMIEMTSQLDAIKELIKNQ